MFEKEPEFNFAVSAPQIDFTQDYSTLRKRVEKVPELKSVRNT